MPKRHILSFDVEEYFQVESARRGGVSPRSWRDWPSRVEGQVDRVLELLADHDATATFFILGWVARQRAGMVRRIAEAGHEIASHGMTHRMLDGVTPDVFARELRASRRLLEDAAAQPVVGYRAPTFSVNHRTAWAFDVLVEQGFEYDSSVFPVHHDRYGVPDAPRWIHRATTSAGASITEIPPLTRRLAGRIWPAGGGGYLRIFPLAWTLGAVVQADRAGKPAMIYVHPWELDPDQPVLPIGRRSNLRHRFGLGRTEAKLRKLLRRFRFASTRSVLTETPEPDLEYLYGCSGDPANHDIPATRRGSIRP